MSEQTNNGEVTVVERAVMDDLGRYNWESRQAQLILKNTIASDATDAEFALFREICRSTGLNPFQKEIWLIITSPDKPQYRRMYAMTGVNGFYRIANERPEYDGIEYEEGPYIKIEIPGHEPILAPEYVISRVYRKDRNRPHIAKAFWREFHGELVTRNGNLGIWAKMPSVMLTKCADSLGLRKSFPQHLNGVFSVEEMDHVVHADESARNFAAAQDEARARKNWLAHKAREIQSGEYKLRHGSLTNEPLSACDNIPHLENHLEKHRQDYAPEEIEAIELRLKVLRREFAEEKAAEAAAPQSHGSGVSDDEAAAVVAEMAEAEPDHD